MRKAAAIVGIVGALAGLFLGVKWLGDLSKVDAVTSGLGKLGQMAGKALDLGTGGIRMASYALLGCGALGLAASVMLFLKKMPAKQLAIGLCAAGALPMVFSTKAIFGLPMVVAGVMAFMLKDEGEAAASSSSSAPPVPPSTGAPPTA